MPNTGILFLKTPCLDETADFLEITRHFIYVCQIHARAQQNLKKGPTLGLYNK